MQRLTGRGYEIIRCISKCSFHGNHYTLFGQNRTVPGANNVISKPESTGYNKYRISGNGRSVHFRIGNA